MVVKAVPIGCEIRAIYELSVIAISAPVHGVPKEGEIAEQAVLKVWHGGLLGNRLLRDSNRHAVSNIGY
eukprot:scaffold504774_cov53-Prasinocladus_malaysianus.AAC.1